ncbi:MAG: choice-of-anchor E domain-containing protein [Dehalococcoidia bacterium]|nr:choice-of-anchor E domain-containing protein [Dehalococcoidia bacterium]
MSGYVYVDANDNGLFDAGETPIGGSSIALRDSTGATVATTLTSSSGYYQFNNDTSVRPPEESVTHSLSFPQTTTDWSMTRSAPRFDPAMGTLTGVDVTNSAAITSGIKAESLDGEASTLSATVSGMVALTIPGADTVTTAPVVEAGSFDAAAYDGIADFSGPSGHDFGSHTASGAATTGVSGPALSQYVGTGTVEFLGVATATSHTTGGGNVLNKINTVASAQVILTYRYLPVVCLKAGSYKIVQTEQPPGYADGRETAGNTTPLPNTKGSDSISITISGGDLPNNNFGELPASISGYVYVDLSNDGIKDAAEPPIAGVTIALSGEDATGSPVNRTTTTSSSGYYLFDGLLAGDYEIVETQPAGYLDGKDTIGSQGGSKSNDHFFAIDLGPGVHGVNNNFGELLPPDATATAPATGTATTGTGTPPRGTATPPGALSPTPVETVSGARTPGPPSAGSGLLGLPATPTNLALFAVVLISLSSWIAIIAMGRRQRGETDGE